MLLLYTIQNEPCLPLSETETTSIIITTIDIIWIVFFIRQSPVVSRACNLYCNIWQRKVKYNTLQMPWTDEKNTEKSQTKLRWIKVCEVNTDHVPRTCARVSSHNNGCQNANLWWLLWRRQAVVTKDKTLLFSITETVKSTLWPRQI